MGLGGTGMPTCVELEMAQGSGVEGVGFWCVQALGTCGAGDPVCMGCRRGGIWVCGTPWGMEEALDSEALESRVWGWAWGHWM